jgi:DNA mismatch repair ATPase MutS
VSLSGRERILAVTGPNNGGKTTLARTIGQLHHLARLGCPVPGRDVRLFACDQIFTRFERREDMTTLEGKLQDELNGMRDALESATADSLFVLNEMFNSTTVEDALFLSRRVLEQISELDAFCVCVTFLDELASLDEKTVSMVAGVDPTDPAVRTYRLVRRPADGRAYARALAEKHGLTYAQLCERRRS